jgi:hypothetical protein
LAIAHLYDAATDRRLTSAYAAQTLRQGFYSAHRSIM